MLNGLKISRDVYSRAMSGVSVAKKNGGQTSAIFANDTRWRPNSQILHRRDRSNSRVTETARPLGVLSYFCQIESSPLDKMVAQLQKRISSMNIGQFRFFLKICSMGSA